MYVLHGVNEIISIWKKKCTHVLFQTTNSYKIVLIFKSIPIKTFPKSDNCTKNGRGQIKRHYFDCKTIQIALDRKCNERNQRATSSQY